LTGRGVGVSDGDTITVLDANREQYKIRPGGIDAPEKGQAFGNASRKCMAELALGKQAKAAVDRIGLWQDRNPMAP
jgi:endonuclease YncB( thermonuclease family)